MEEVGGMHAGQSQTVGRMPGDAGTFPEYTLMTLDHIAVQMRSSG